MTIIYINPVITGFFFLHTRSTLGVGGLVGTPRAISPLTELELREENERVQRVETKRLASCLMF